MRKEIELVIETQVIASDLYQKLLAIKTDILFTNTDSAIACKVRQVDELFNKFTAAWQKAKTTELFARLDQAAAGEKFKRTRRTIGEHCED